MPKIQRLHINSRASKVVIHEQRVETSGIVAKNPPGKDIGEQTKCVFSQLEQLLHDAGSHKNRILKIQIWLGNMDDFDAMNNIYDEWVYEIDRPVRACVGAQLANPDYLIEIQATAILD